MKVSLALFFAALAVASNAAAWVGQGDSVVTPLDLTPPTAIVTRAGATPTSANQVAFSIEFDRSVGNTFAVDDVTATDPGFGASFQLAGSESSFVLTAIFANAGYNGDFGVLLGTDIRDGFGNSFAGESSPLYEVYKWPGFAVQPPDTIQKYLGDMAFLAVDAEYGPFVPSFQWYFDDGASGPAALGTSDTIEIGPLGTSDLGLYWCDVTFDNAIYTSNSAFVSVAGRMQLAVPPMTKYGYIGDAHSFTVTPAFGYLPYQYTWRKGASIVGTAPAYSIPAISWADAGRYSVQVADDVSDVVTSPEALLYVAPHVRFVGQPVGAVKYVGQSHTFTTSGTGGYAPLEYTWTRAGNTLGTGTSYGIPSLSVSDSGWYIARITDLYGDTVTSLGAQLRVAERLQIATQPQAGNRYTGDPLTLSVATTGGHQPLKYSWRKGLNVVGTESSYQIPALQTTDTGWYSAVISDAKTEVVQTVAVSLTVRGHLVISTQPQGANKYIGQSYTFVATANGGYTPFTYTWKKGNTTVGSGALLELTNLQPADTGNYRVIVADSNTDVLSSNIVPLVVKPGVLFTAQPQGATVPAGSTYVFQAGVNGGYPPYSYTWRKGSTVVGHDPTYTVPSVGVTDQGWYSVQVTDIYGSTRTSAGARLALQSKAAKALEEPLYITKQPEGGVAQPGDAISLTVETSGGVAPLDYTWKRNDLVVGEGPELQISRLMPSDSGYYSVEINDDAGQLAVSNAVQLEVTDQGVPVAEVGGLALLMTAVTVIARRKLRRP